MKTNDLHFVFVADNKMMKRPQHIKQVSPKVQNSISS